MTQALTVFVVVVVAMTLLMMYQKRAQRRAYARDMAELKYYTTTYLRRQAWMSDIGPYEIMSFDGGLAWYAVNRGDSGVVIIRGLADDIFPGLLHRLEGMEGLAAYVEKNGPVTLSGKRAGADRGAIEAAGVSVKTVS